MEKYVELRVRYKETDQMGVVYYSNYFVWFEVARTEYFRQLGYSYKQLEDEGIILPAVEAHCEYKASAHYDDELVVKIWIDNLTGVKITFQYEVYRKYEKKLLAKGYTIHAFVDANKRPVSLKKVRPQIWQTFKGDYMFLKLILTFAIVPILELIVLIQLGRYIGLWPTILIVAATGFLGIILARSQGLGIFFRIKDDLSEGRIPADEILNGLCVLVGGAMLLTPGLITDTAGFILIIPTTRNIVKSLLRSLLQKLIKHGTIRFYKIK